MGFDFYSVLGLIVIIVLVVSLFKGRGKNTEDTKYDERQQLIRSRNYRIAYWVLLAYTALNGIYSLIADRMWADTMTSAFIGICLSITVFVVACIFKDAYFPVNRNPGFYFVLFGIVIVVDAIVTVRNILSENVSFFTGGMLNTNAMNPVVAVMFVIILAALGIKRAAVNKGEAE